MDDEAMEALELAEVAIEEARPKWIPCSERMPEPGAEVLIVRRDARYDIGPTLYLGTHDPKGGYHVWRTAEIDFEAEEVSHWMPRPAPPES